MLSFFCFFTCCISVFCLFSFYFLNWVGVSSILGVLAYFQIRSTIYTITNKRVVLRIGAALPITFNIPFKQISSVGVRTYGKTGSIALALSGNNKISYISCWPHARPWCFAKPEPSLIFLENIDDAARFPFDPLLPCDSIHHELRPCLLYTSDAADE